MTREIKFRGKRINPVGEHTWAYGYYSKNRYGSVIWLEDEFGGWQDIPIVEGTQGEFTGLRDKNGVEIYEGDIIKFGEYLMLVRWQKETASFSLAKDGWLYDHFFTEAVRAEDSEVIGNIYENPELLEAQR